MRRGTTPTLLFTTPYDAEMVRSGYITFTSRGNVILDIPTSDESVTIMNQYISLTLTQAQTLAFNVSGTCLVQIRLILNNDTVVASNIVKVPVEGILKEGEING